MIPELILKLSFMEAHLRESVEGVQVLQDSKESEPEKLWLGTFKVQVESDDVTQSCGEHESRPSQERTEGVMEASPWILRETPSKSCIQKGARRMLSQLPVCLELISVGGRVLDSAWVGG